MSENSTSTALEETARAIGRDKNDAGRTTGQSLSRATGQLCHILAETLRRELQTLDRGQVREDRLAEGLRRHAVLERQCQGLNAVGAFGRENLAAKEPGALCVRHQLDEPTRIASGKRARHLIEWHD